MGVLKIDCYCNEVQMDKIVDMVVDHIAVSGGSEIADFDDVIGNVRVFVEFDNYIDKISLKTSELLDDNWDLLYEDTAVFTSRLRLAIDDFNRNSREVRYQAHHVLKDRWTY